MVAVSVAVDRVQAVESDTRQVFGGRHPVKDDRLVAGQRIQEIDDAVLINLLPSLDLEYSDIATIVESLIQRRLGIHVVVNLSLVQYIGSTFLGHLIAAKQKVTASNGRFILCGFNPVVEEIFRVTRLDGFFEIADVEAVVPKGA